MANEPIIKVYRVLEYEGTEEELRTQFNRNGVKGETRYGVSPTIREIVAPDNWVSIKENLRTVFDAAWNEGHDHGITQDVAFEEFWEGEGIKIAHAFIGGSLNSVGHVLRI